MVGRGPDDPCSDLVGLQERNCKFTGPKSFIMGSKQTYSFLPRLFTIQISLKRKSGAKAVSASNHKTCRNVRDPESLVS